MYTTHYDPELSMIYCYHHGEYAGAEFQTALIEVLESVPVGERLSIKRILADKVGVTVASYQDSDFAKTAGFYRQVAALLNLTSEDFQNHIA